MKFKQLFRVVVFLYVKLSQSKSSLVALLLFSLVERLIYGVQQVTEEVSKTLQSIKTMLYGTVDQEPATEQVAMLSTEMYQTNTLPLLIQNLARVDFEVG